MYSLAQELERNIFYLPIWSSSVLALEYALQGDSRFFAALNRIEHTLFGTNTHVSLNRNHVNYINGILLIT